MRMAEVKSTTWKKFMEIPMTEEQLADSKKRFAAARAYTDYFESEEELNEILDTVWAEICEDGIIIWADM